MNFSTSFALLLFYKDNLSSLKNLRTLKVIFRIFLAGDSKHHLPARPFALVCGISQKGEASLIATRNGNSVCKLCRLQRATGLPALCFLPVGRGPYHFLQVLTEQTAELILKESKPNHTNVVELITVTFISF